MKKRLSLDTYKKYVNVVSRVCTELVEGKIIFNHQANVVFGQLMSLLIDERLSGVIESDLIEYQQVYICSKCKKVEEDERKEPRTPRKTDTDTNSK